MFAIFGTAISALVIGSGVYLLGIADVAYQLNFIESFAFGSLISGEFVELVNRLKRSNFSLFLQLLIQSQQSQFFMPWTSILFSTCWCSAKAF